MFARHLNLGTGQSPPSLCGCEHLQSDGGPSLVSVLEQVALVDCDEDGVCEQSRTRMVSVDLTAAPPPGIPSVRLGAEDPAQTAQVSRVGLTEELVAAVQRGDVEGESPRSPADPLVRDPLESINSTLLFGPLKVVVQTRRDEQDRTDPTRGLEERDAVVMVSIT